MEKIFKLIYGEDLYLLKREYFLMSRFNIFYKRKILENINYILLDLVENLESLESENYKEMRKIINLISNYKYKEMREYIKKDIFFSL